MSGSEHFNQVLTAVDQACVDFQNPGTHAQATQVLLQLRLHPQALAVCRHILEHSHSPDSRFQAALTLKEALLRDWASLEPQEADMLTMYVWHSALRCGGDEPGSARLRASLVAVLAVAIKRGWLEKLPDARTVLLQEVVGVVSSCGSNVGGVQAARVGLQVLEAVVTEFNLSTASPLGLPWAHHDHCCRDLEEKLLREFFKTASGLARQAATAGAAAQGQDGGATSTALSLLTACLQWEFRRSGLPGMASMHVSHNKLAQRSAVNAPVLAPGEAWSQLLLDPNNTGWMVDLAAQLRAAYGTLSGSAILHDTGSRATPALAGLTQAQRGLIGRLCTELRELLVALCNMSGEVFPRQDPGGLRLRFLHSLLQALLPAIWPLDRALAAAVRCGWDESELRDVCRCIAAAAQIHRAALLQAAATPVMKGLVGAEGGSHAGDEVWIPGAHAPGLLGLLELLTLALVRQGGVNSNGTSNLDEGDDKYWLQECTDMLLEAWASLLTVDGMGGGAQQLPPGTAAAAASVFLGVVGAALEDAAAGVNEEVETEHEAAATAGQEEWMARLAGLARAAPQTTFAHLTQGLAGAQQALAAAAASGSDPSVPLEQLCWLTRQAAHCLADSGAGETPMVPLPLMQMLDAQIPGVGEAVVALGQALLSLPPLVLSPGARPVMSPRLMEACVWALARWVDTYLFPEEPLPGGLQTVYGASAGGGSGLSIQDMVVQVANACLTSYPGENELHKQVVGVLLPVLVRRKPLCERLTGLPAWRALVQAFASRQDVLSRGLSQKLQRGLSQSLCLAAGGISRTTAAQDYIKQLLATTVAEVAGLAAQPDLSTLAGRTDVAAGLCGALEVLRGAVRGTLPRTQPALFEALSGLLEPLLSLALAFRTHTQAVALVLKLASELVEHHVSYLKPHEADGLMRWVLALLQQYATTNTWALKLAASRSQQEVTTAEAARDLRALLRLLGHVTQRDLAEGGAGGGRVAATTAANAHHGQPLLDTAQVVLTGLNILLPLISTELLKFPKLPRLYFNLLAYMLESYPEQVVSLSPVHFATLMSSLEFGLGAAGEPTVLQSALEGLAGLARYQQQCVAAGLPGLGVHSAAGGRTVTSHFLELLLRSLLLGDWDQDIVELAAEALQSFLVVDPATYAALATQMVQAHLQDPVAGDKINAALASLLHPEQLAGVGGANGVNGATRHSKRAFRTTLCAVVAGVRSLVRMK